MKLDEAIKTADDFLWHASECAKNMNRIMSDNEMKALRTVIEAAEELVEIKKMMQDEFNKVRSGGTPPDTALAPKHFKGATEIYNIDNKDAVNKSDNKKKG